MSEIENVRAAEVELSCQDLAEAIDVFARVGFRVETIMPADDPSSAVIQGHGVRLRLIRGEDRRAVVRVLCRDPAAISASALVTGGIRIELVPDDTGIGPKLDLAPVDDALVVTKNDVDRWRIGRAGMHYRDLIPDRRGGRFIASHIRIAEGGPVPDYVHFHAIRFQMIYCYKGWVRLVYEDQGPPFVMHAGECVLQPPKIRHRVLECSPGLEVIEIGAPAVHATHADHDLPLPTPHVRPERDFGGQRFRWHRTDGGDFGSTNAAAAGPLGIASATHGVADARVVHGAPDAATIHHGELFFGFILAGGMTVHVGDPAERGAARLRRSVDEGARSEPLNEGDAFVVPAERPYRLTNPTPDLAWLNVTLPA